MKISDANKWAFGMAAALLRSDMDCGEVPAPDEPDREIKERQLRKLIAILEARSSEKAP